MHSFYQHRTLRSTVSLLALVVAAGLVFSACDSTGPKLEPDQEQKVYPDDFVVPPSATNKARPSETGPPAKVPVCHKFGTPAQKTLILPVPGAMGHVQGHGDFFGTCDGRIIDADGTESPERGLPEFIDAGLVVGASLTSWPTGFFEEGLDWFDTDGNCTWTLGDDLHAEGSAHPGAIRDGVHDAGEDPVVLDLDGSLTDGQQVDVDLESGTTFTGCDGPDPLLKFFDKNGNSFWDDGEDIVLDRDNDGVFN